MLGDVTTINVPRKIRKSGTVRVRETGRQIEALINAAKRKKQMFITLTEAEDGTEFTVKYSLINGWQ